MFSLFSDEFRFDFIARVESFDGLSVLNDHSFFLPDLVDDFIRHCSSGVNEGHLVMTKEEPLLFALRLTQVLQDRVNYTFTSFYRTQNENLRIGGAKNSQHLFGNAVDVSTDLSSSRLVILKNALSDFSGISVGLSKSHLHFDFRKGQPIMFFE